MFLQRHQNDNYYLFFNDVITSKRKKVSLKTSDPKQAQKLLFKYQSFPHLIYSELMDNGKKFLDKKFDNLALDKIKTQTVYLDTYLKQYIQHSESHHTIKTQKAIKQTLKFLCAFIGKVEFDSLRKMSLVDCLNLTKTIDIKTIDKSLMEKYFSVRTENSSIYQSRKDRINLSGFFTFLIDHNILTENPVSKIKLQKIPQKLPLFINETDFQTIIDHTDNEVLRNLFQVAYYTGMRLMELVTLKYSMLDFAERIIKLDNQHVITKSKKFRVIPMNQTVFDILSKMKDSAYSDNVFYDLLNQHDKSDFVTKSFKKIVRSISNIDHRYKFHDLRSSFATRLNIAGINPTVTQKLLGHANISTTLLYTHVQDSQMKDAISKL